jgi:Uma2 family endonuclease
MADVLTPATPKRQPRQFRRATLDAYFRAEEKSIHKHEYHNGFIIPMPGAKLPHNLLATSIGALIVNFVIDQDLPYMVSNSATKIRIEEFDRVVYPDAVVICEKPEFYQGRQDTITNPLIVVEVLSESTEKFDRGGKFEYYRSLPSFQEYVLVSQERKNVSVYTRQPDNTWLLRDYTGEEAVGLLYALHNCPLPLKRLYRGIKL